MLVLINFQPQPQSQPQNHAIQAIVIMTVFAEEILHLSVELDVQHLNLKLLLQNHAIQAIVTMTVFAGGILQLSVELDVQHLNLKHLLQSRAIQVIVMVTVSVWVILNFIADSHVELTANFLQDFVCHNRG